MKGENDSYFSVALRYLRFLRVGTECLLRSLIDSLYSPIYKFDWLPYIKSSIFRAIGSVVLNKKGAQAC